MHEKLCGWHANRTSPHHRTFIYLSQSWKIYTLCFKFFLFFLISWFRIHKINPSSLPFFGKRQTFSGNLDEISTYSHARALNKYICANKIHKESQTMYNNPEREKEEDEEH